MIRTSGSGQGEGIGVGGGADVGVGARVVGVGEGVTVGVLVGDGEGLGLGVTGSLVGVGRRRGVTRWAGRVASSVKEGKYESEETLMKKMAPARSEKAPITSTERNTLLVATSLSKVKRA